MKKKIFLSYLLGLSLGLVLFSFYHIYNGNDGNAEIQNITKQMETMAATQKEIQAENDKLTEEIAQANKKLQESPLESPSEVNEVDSEGGPVIIEIKTPITYADIAIQLVEKGVYPFENDLVMLMEMIQYNKYQGAKLLAENDVIPNEERHISVLSAYDTNRYRIRKDLYAAGLIQDENAFSKVLYFFDSESRIIPGEKVFRKNMSLREIADVLTGLSQ